MSLTDVELAQEVPQIDLSVWFFFFSGLRLAGLEGEILAILCTCSSYLTHSFVPGIIMATGEADKSETF